MPRRPLTDAERLESKKRKQEACRKYAKSEKGKALNLKNKKKHLSIPEYREHINKLRRLAYQAKKRQLHVDKESNECQRPKLGVERLNMTECQNRWPDSFPAFIPRTTKNKMAADFAESIYNIPENTPDSTSSPESVPLVNPDWPPEGRQDDAKQSSTSNDASNTNSPVIKLEVDIDDGSQNDALCSADGSGYGCIIPSSVCEVVTDIQQSHIQRCRTPTERRDIGTEFEFFDSSGEHPIEMFFKSMGATVKTFPPHLMVIAKLKVAKIIADLELQAMAEMGVDNAGYCGSNGSKWFASDSLDHHQEIFPVPDSSR
ncbi:hypothetical protein CDAR_121031 [Caerostris darwini]|uniref:Uncharacterized protein n=1 Tax=Caerostris darwini TaxID=1538125 RepID=A0AAV4QSH5_9ARAC|nr:hypothetical protein CDAR_121031 [Caerostris darwini]